MKTATLTSYLRKNFSDTETIDIIKEAGFDYIDFSFFPDQHSFDIDTDKELFKKRFTEMRKYAEDKGISFYQAHAPEGSSTVDEAWTAKRFEEIVCSMRNASYLGIKHIIVHPCQHLPYMVEGNPEILFEYNMDFYSRLLPYAEEYGLVICTENMWQLYANKKIWVSTCATPEEFNRYIDQINSPFFKGCLDIGHTLIVGQDPAAFIRKMGADRLVALHVHDVDGTNDNHTLPYFGIVRWNEVTASLKQIGYKGNITLEADGFLKGLPKELLADGEKFMAAVARNIANAVE
ncbi:MAG: sugar phosphate isomerase/epimerase [Clostridia bacterium]|nr:sugar phosphate isomerase/epimerase [Clostridia bacterium]